MVAELVCQLVRSLQNASGAKWSGSRFLISIAELSCFSELPCDYAGANSLISPVRKPELSAIGSCRITERRSDNVFDLPKMPKLK